MLSKKEKPKQENESSSPAESSPRSYLLSAPFLFDPKKQTTPPPDSKENATKVMPYPGVIGV